MAYLRTTLRLPVRQVQGYLATLHGLRLSAGEIVELGHAVSRELQEPAHKLLHQARSKPIVHQDETGWRENGQNGYVWTLATAGPEAVRYFEFDTSRGHLVARHLLGDRFRGVLVSDFYSAYNLLRVRHQRCWVHLLRDLHKLKEQHADDAEVVTWAQDVRQLYDSAQTWLQDNPQPSPAARSETYTQLATDSDNLALPYARSYQHPCCTLSKRLLRHRDELFQFDLVRGLPAHNNRAERSIRPLVVIRTISGGTRSEQGTKTRLTLASVLGTWQTRQLTPLEQCREALQFPAWAVRPAPT